MISTMMQPIDDSNAVEFYEERVAIMHFDGGLKGYDAEHYARLATWRYCRRTGFDEPDSVVYRMLCRDLTGKEPVAPGTDDADHGCIARDQIWTKPYSITGSAAPSE
jgi:hypothetical protein